MPRHHPLHSSLPAGRLANRVLSPFPSRQCSSSSEVCELAGEGRLHTTDDVIVLLVRKPTPSLAPDSQRSVGRVDCLLNDEPLRIYVPVLMHPWVVQAFCHLGTTRTLRLLERFCWWIVNWYEYVHQMAATQLLEVPSTETLAADAPATRRVDLLPEGPAIPGSIDYFGPVPDTP